LRYRYTHTEFALVAITLMFSCVSTLKVCYWKNAHNGNTRLHTHTHTCTHTHRHTHTHIHTQTRTHAHTGTHIHTQTRTHAQTHIHTHRSPDALGSFNSIAYRLRFPGWCGGVATYLTLSTQLQWPGLARTEHTHGHLQTVVLAENSHANGMLHLNVYSFGYSWNVRTRHGLIPYQTWSNPIPKQPQKRNPEALQAVNPWGGPPHGADTREGSPIIALNPLLEGSFLALGQSGYLYEQSWSSYE